MALLFSAVTLTGDDDQVELLVPGIPKEPNDLRSWTAYENFIQSIDHEQEIRVHVAACLYGEGEAVNATPEEIAYLTLRAKANDDFFYDHCRHAGHSDFQFKWSPQITFEMEMTEMNEWDRLHRQAQQMKNTYAAACSVSDRVLFQMLKDNPNIQKVYLCMDNDEAGQKADNRIAERLSEQKILYEVLVPIRKDWNEDLLLQSEEKEEEEPCQTLAL